MFPQDIYRVAEIRHDERTAGARTPCRDIPSVQVPRFGMPTWATRMRDWLHTTARAQRPSHVRQPASLSVR
jgi:hypothetical protein